jgi:hypothetical protein
MVLASLLGLSSCATFQPQAVLVAPATPGLRVEIGPEVQGRADATITAPSLAEGVLYGQAEKTAAGGWTVSLSSLRWFNNGLNGWTDASFFLDGTLLLEKSDHGWILKAPSLPVVEGVARASVRYFDTFLLGNKAAEQLSARWDRIEAVTAYLRDQFPDGWIDDQTLVSRFLFPEIYGYAANESPGKERVTVDSVDWDKNYTAAHFPARLAPLRESGIMLRDYQESPGLWRLLYHWKSTWGSETSLVLKKTR